MDNLSQKLKNQVGLVGAICGSLLMTLPAMATPRMANDTSIENPNPPATMPSPYLQKQHTGDGTQPRKSTGSSMQSGSSTSPSSTSIENPNPPATMPSPYLQKQHTGDARQPHKSTGSSMQSGSSTSPSSTSIENPNPPATISSPYLQKQHTGGATQPANQGQ
jgi:hypothetical protein